MNNEGDPWCAERYPDGSRPFCGWDLCFADVADGCVAERPEPECHSACGDRKKLSEDPDCEGVADGSSSSGSATVGTTEPGTSEPTSETLSTTMTASETEGSSTTSTGCTDSSECGEATPICENSECVACTAAGTPDAACAERDALVPVCGDEGACVQCTPGNASACGDTTPVCDGPSSSCVGCTYHEQCSESACRIATGACFDAAEVYDVGDGQTYEEINDAVTDLGEGVQVVLVLHAGPDFNEPVTISGVDTAYAFISADDPAPQWVQTMELEPTLAVESMAEAYVQNVQLTANTFSGAAAVRADGASVYLDRTEVVGNDGGGISLTNGASARLRNCFVGGANNQPAAEVQSSSMQGLYSTFAGAFGASPGLMCTNPNAVVVRNSIIVAQANEELDCGDADITFTATEQMTAGTGNVMVGDLQELTWFADYDGGDFTLLPPGAAVFADIAQWQTGDPIVDIDGDARPGVDGTPDVAGADILP